MRPLSQLKFLAVTLVLIATPVSAPIADAGAYTFLTGFADIPLFDGLIVNNETGVNFDTPAGRIVETIAEGRVTRESVTRFYQSTLPQLGWVRAGTLAFEREGERLTLSMRNANGGLAVHFKITPK
jgi:hypothetical protein